MKIETTAQKVGVTPGVKNVTSMEFKNPLGAAKVDSEIPKGRAIRLSKVVLEKA